MQLKIKLCLPSMLQAYSYAAVSTNIGMQRQQLDLRISSHPLFDHIPIASDQIKAGNSKNEVFLQFKSLTLSNNNLFAFISRLSQQHLWSLSSREQNGSNLAPICFSRKARLELSQPPATGIGKEGKNIPQCLTCSFHPCVHQEYRNSFVLDLIQKLIHIKS